MIRTIILAAVTAALFVGLPYLAFANTREITDPYKIARLNCIIGVKDYKSWGDSSPRTYLYDWNTRTVLGFSERHIYICRMTQNHQLEEVGRLKLR